MVKDEESNRSPAVRIGGLFVLTGAGIGSSGLLGKLLLGQFLASIFLLVAATVTLLCGPVLAGMCGIWFGGDSQRPRILGVQTAIGYVIGSLVALGLLGLGGDLPLVQLGGSLLVFAVPTGLVGAGVNYLSRKKT